LDKDKSERLWEESIARERLEKDQAEGVAETIERERLEKEK
jgi:hypothetical protein